MTNIDSLDPALVDLLYQVLETEQCGVRIYEAAIACAQNDELRAEWKEYLKETRTHEEVVLVVFEAFGLDPVLRPSSRDVIGGIGDALVDAMRKAKAAGSPEQAELVACECVVLAESKDHSNWELLAHVADRSRGMVAKVLRAAVDEIEEDEDNHLYHTRGWCRELWIQALGFPAVLPPPEEITNVESATGAWRAEQSRDAYL